MKDKHKKKHADKQPDAVLANGALKHGDLPSPAADAAKSQQIGKDVNYDKELGRLQVELVKLQEWVRTGKAAGGDSV